MSSAVRWTARGDTALFARERAHLQALLSAGRSALEQRSDLAPPCFLKASPLSGRAALRHAARRALGAELPRLAEQRNLEWLRAHGFDAPRPVLAGAAWRGALPAFQFLYTEAVPGAETLAQALARGGARAHDAALALARLAARLHAQGFVHRDLFARNALLQDRADGPPRLWLLDAWRGGHGRGRGPRGPAYDVGCLLHDLSALGAEDLVAPVLAAYAAERAALGQAVPHGFGRGVARARAGRAARDARAARKRGAADPA